MTDRLTSNLLNDSVDPIERAGGLQLWRVNVRLTDHASEIEQRFLEEPELPGCMVIGAHGAIVGLISRKNLFKALSRPFAREVFVRRPVEALSEFIDTSPPVISPDTLIADAVARAFERTGDEAYEPLIVDTSEGAGVLEVDLLMRTQTRLLIEALQMKQTLLSNVERTADELRAALADLEQTRDRLLASEQHLEQEVLRRTQELADTNAALRDQQAQIDAELEVARSLQQSILPAEFPRHSAFSGKAVMRAARMIGGDFYDMFMLDANHLGMVVADVSGKGVPAALFMVLARTVMQDVAPSHRSPAACIEQINQILEQRNPVSLFVTMVYAILDIRTGQVRYCNAGHLAPYVLRADETLHKPSDRTSPLVGLLPRAQYADLSVDLACGDSLMLMTDGIPECFNPQGETFGEERLEQLLLGSSRSNIEGTLGEIFVALDAFRQERAPSDDVTALMVHYQGAEAQRVISSSAQAA